MEEKLVSLENENYSQDVENIKQCLQKQKNLARDSKLGVGQGFRYDRYEKEHGGGLDSTTP